MKIFAIDDEDLHNSAFHLLESLIRESTTYFHQIMHVFIVRNRRNHMQSALVLLKLCFFNDANFQRDKLVNMISGTSSLFGPTKLSTSKTHHTVVNALGNRMWQLSSDSNFLLFQVFYLFCMAVHTVEGLLGFYWSRFRHRLNWFATFKWTISSFIHGYFSLRLLYNPQQKK